MFGFGMFGLNFGYYFHNRSVNLLMFQLVELRCSLDQELLTK